MTNDPRQEDISNKSSCPATAGDDSEAALPVETWQWEESFRAFYQGEDTLVEINDSQVRQLRKVEERLKEVKRMVERIPPGEERTRQDRQYKRCCLSMTDLRKRVVAA